MQKKKAVLNRLVSQVVALAIQDHGVLIEPIPSGAVLQTPIEGPGQSSFVLPMLVPVTSEPVMQSVKLKYYKLDQEKSYQFEEGEIPLGSVTIDDPNKVDRIPYFISVILP